MDAFTACAFGGNPAAVVFNHFSEDIMQKLAAENNVAVTAFAKRVFPENDQFDASSAPEFYLR